VRADDVDGRQSCPAPPLLEARGLAAGYNGVPVVLDVDLRVDRGEVVALLGPNGVGKTTTLLTLSGELSPIAGEVKWQGVWTKAPLYKRARQGLGLVTEDRSVFMGLSTADNIRLGRIPRARVLAVFPELGAVMRSRAGLLSGGEQQMLAIARALARDPKLLLVDELSLGLAPLIVQRLLRAVRHAASDRGIGVLFVEQHVPRALSVADRVYVMQRGKIALEGIAKEVARDLGHVRDIYLGRLSTAQESISQDTPTGATE
jgi:ABC-type branched-subunit amino acid transport system ATPase component